MKVCTYMNLAAAAALVAVVSFPACNASTIQTTAADEPKTPAAAPAGNDTPAAPETAAPAADDSAAPAGDGTAAPAASGEAAGGEADRSTDAIAAVIKDSRKQFRACYDKAQKEIPSLQGNLVLHFVLDGMGTVKSAELNIERSDIKSPKVVDCAIKILKGLKFPPHPRGKDTVVNYPFNFRPH